PLTKRGCVQPGTEMAWKFGRSPVYSALTVQLLAKGGSHEMVLVLVGEMCARPGAQWSRTFMRQIGRMSWRGYQHPPRAVNPTFCIRLQIAIESSLRWEVDVSA